MAQHKEENKKAYNKKQEGSGKGAINTYIYTNKEGSRPYRKGRANYTMLMP